MHHHQNKKILFANLGGFQLVDLIITELKDYMTCYSALIAMHWWKKYW